ncbi:MAG: metal-dependent hydrolase [Halobacteriales archaeon]
MLQVTAALGYLDLAYLGIVAAVGLTMHPDVALGLPFVPHRGPTHTVWFALLIAAGAGSLGWRIDVGPVPKLVLAGYGDGMAGLAIGSQALADALMPMGVRPVAPLTNRHVTVALTGSSNPLANLLVLSFGIGLAVGGFVLAG